MKKLWSQVSGFPVVLPEDEKRLGSLNGVFMDPETGQIIAFLVGYSRVLTPIEIEKWRSDRVQVNSKDALSPVSEILRIERYGLRRSFLNGKRVFSKSSKRLGRVHDFSFDPSTNSILDFEVSRRFFWFEWGKRIFSYKDIEEVTERAILLNVDPEEKVKAGKRINVPAMTGV